MGLRKFKEHRKILRIIQQRFGVDSAILVALWAAETGYGHVQGRHKLIPTILTQAYTSHRQTFTVAQLIFALKMLEKLGDVQPYQLLSTYDGGMGMIQMDPSTYMQYAVPFQGKGMANIWKSVPDAMASAAHLLFRFHWQRGLIWGVPIVINRDIQRQYAKKRKWFLVSDMQKLHLSSVYHQVKSAESLKIIQPDVHTNHAYLVTNNFKVLLRWNHNTNQAIMVGSMADYINAKAGIK